MVSAQSQNTVLVCTPVDLEISSAGQPCSKRERILAVRSAEMNFMMLVVEEQDMFVLEYTYLMVPSVHEYFRTMYHMVGIDID